MSLELLAVSNDSDPDKEVVQIKVLQNCSTQGYAIVDKTFTDLGEPSNEFRHIFIFPNLQVKKGDYIRVHTGVGDYRPAIHDLHTTTHMLYWNSEEAVWNDRGGDKASLIQYNVIDTCDVPAKKPAPGGIKMSPRRKLP